MKFQLVGHGWPVGARLIEEGTVIDTSSPEWAWLPPEAIPINAQALDQAAWDALLLHYSGLDHRLQPKGF
jgi:hypothetical protein